MNEKTVKNKITTSNHFPSATREWKNSIYAFNKNTLNAIPITTNTTMKLIKNYFSLYNNFIERKMRTKRLLLRFRRLSSNKIYISNGEFKHTNNKVVITLYLYNRQKSNYILAIKNFYLKSLFTYKKKLNISKILINRLKYIEYNGLLKLKTINKNNMILLNTLNSTYKINTNTKLYEYVNNFYKKILKKSLRKIKLYFYYKQLIYINKSKYNYTYLQYLKKYLENLYNKNIEFNLVNLKRFYLNSDILTDSIKLKLTKNRRKMRKYMNKIKNKIKTKKKKIILNEMQEQYIEINNMSNKKNLLSKDLVNNLKYKHVTGFRLEAKGRLTRRYTASRSISKLRYKGNLLDIDSSYKGLYSMLLKGNLKSNVQYTKLNSKSRIGSFGLKGWISGN